jgi:hypothetical protein
MSGLRDRLLGKQPPLRAIAAETPIHVTMVDAATDRVMGEADLNPAQLPDSFDLSALASALERRPRPRRR